jgi:hypothetical protein
MARKSKLLTPSAKPKQSSLAGRLDVASPATAAAFRVAAEAYTKRATKTKGAAIKILHGEGILKKRGGLAKPYALKG